MAARGVVAERPIPNPDGPPATYLTQVLADLRERRREEIARHERELAQFDGAIRQAERERELVLRGVPLDVVRTAESVLEVRGRGRAGDHEARAMIAAAIDDLAGGARELRHDYFGTKDYDRWRGQGVKCEYGRSPSHGSVVFSIGLRDDARRRELEPDEVEASILYLMALLPRKGA